jgi:putative acetyltransferase
MNNKITIRSYSEADAPFLAAIYFHTIHKVNTKDYSAEQLNVWAPSTSLETEGWIKKWKNLPPIVATINDKVVGFAEFEDNGHIDCFYCHHEYQGCGIGSVLMKEIESRARKLKINKIFADVSITAKPFFEAKGFIVKKEQSVIVRGVALTNFVMEKILIP